MCAGTDEYVRGAWQYFYDINRQTTNFYHALPTESGTQVQTMTKDQLDELSSRTDGVIVSCSSMYIREFPVSGAMQEIQTVAQYSNLYCNGTLDPQRLFAFGGGCGI